MKRFVRIALVVAVWATVTWIFREKLLPVPKPDPAPPPHFRASDEAPRLHLAEPLDAPPSTPGPDDRQTGGDTGEVAAPDGSTSPTPVPGDDLTHVKGIGPVYQHRLTEIGIRSFSDLVAGNAASIAEAIDVSESHVEEWIDQARRLAEES